jgi:heat shock protein HslJ
MSHDPIEQKIARTLQAKAHQVPIRDRLSELQQAQPDVRRRFIPLPLAAAVATFALAVVAVGGLLLMRNATSEPAAGSTMSVPTTPGAVTSTTVNEITYESLHGIWSLTSFSVAGEEDSVELGGNAANPPWIEIDENGLHGNLGCNAFSSTEEPTLVGGVLATGKVAQTYARCGGSESDPPSLMAVETVFSDVVTAESGVKVLLTETGMT